MALDAEALYLQLGQLLAETPLDLACKVDAPRGVGMATHALSEHFNSFFGRLNPSTTWGSRAASQYAGISGVLEGQGPLAPELFLQGSYRRDTAIYTINDIDIVAMCRLWYPGSGSAGSRSWSRDEIFADLAGRLEANGAYAGKVRYGPTSLCIKLDLGIQVEILPVVFKAENSDASVEPFYMYRPELGRWVEGFARVHQQALTQKNKPSGNFIPAVKVFKHLRKRWSVNAVSFHIECLLHAFHDDNFVGGPADYIADVLNTVAFNKVGVWPGFGIKTPARDRELFSDSEWSASSFAAWHAAMANLAPYAKEARETDNRGRAIQLWRWILGEDYFPA